MDWQALAEAAVRADRELLGGGRLDLLGGGRLGETAGLGPEEAELQADDLRRPWVRVCARDEHQIVLEAADLAAEGHAALLAGLTH